ncbi:MAG: ferritin-like domain-containing protein [Sphingobacteriales bacterium]|nr:MAG: ferritin-like domain-containing protein [Sphingobacteriales bacterium]
MAKASKSAAGRKGAPTKAASKAGGRSSSTRSTSTTSRSSSAASSRSASASRSNTGSRKSAPSFDEATLLHELFVEELRDIYWAEKHLTKALPKMAKAATSQELRGAFENHLAQTEEQIGRVEQVFEMLDLPARAKKCEAMEGLVKEAQQGIEDTPKGSSVRDAALIICAQKVEHYEIAAYGSLAQLAKTMGRNEVADLLAQTLEEEKETDQLLTELAVSGINITAEQESE